MSNQSLSFDSIDLGSATYGVRHVVSPVQAQPDFRLHLHALLGRDGVTDQGNSFQARRLLANCILIGGSNADRLDRLDLVKAVVTPTAGVKSLRFDFENHLEREYMARVNGPIIVTLKGSANLQFQLNFIVPSVFARDRAETSQTITVDETPEAFNVPAAGTVPGSVEKIRPVWVITNTNAGATSSCVLVNTTRSETLTWTGALAHNDKLRIDCQREAIEKSDDGGSTYSSVISGMTVGDPFPLLTPGVQNAMTLTGVTDGSVVVTYRGLYL